MFWTARSVFCYIFSGVIAHLSMRVVTNDISRGKKSEKISIFQAIIVKRKQRSAIKAIYVFQRILECSYLAQLHVFWK